MTNSNEESPLENERDQRRLFFEQMMSDLGIAETHGVDLLRLVKMTANAYDVITAERMREENLSAPRWRVLLHLYMEDQCGAGVLSPTQLSQMQRLSKNTVSAHLRSLEEQGLIEREVDPDDLRQFRILISEAGRQLIRETTPGHMDFLNQPVADLSTEDVQQIQALLRKLHRSLLRHSGAPMCENERD